MRRKKLFGARSLLTLFLCISAFSLSAQTITVRGIVTDDGHEPVIGATVVVKGDPSKGTITDLDGNYVLNDVPSDGILTFSYVGLQPQDVRIEGRTTINVEMKSDTKLLDEVVVVGYGTQKKVNVTGAVSMINADELAKVPVPNITQSLAGRAPGLIVQQSGGGVNTKASISIRGGGRPLYVIDGIICEERDFQNLNPEDIDQMSVLKDASATAVYGVKGANGVVVVTTKRGRSGAPKVSLTYNFGMSELATQLDLLNSYDYARFRNEAIRNDNDPSNFDKLFSESGFHNELWKFKNNRDYTPQEVEAMNLTPEQKQALLNSPALYYTSHNYFKEAFGGVSPQTQFNLNVSGGSEKTRYFTSLGYFYQGGTFKETNYHNADVNSKYQRYNFRSNFDFELTDRTNHRRPLLR